MRDSLFRELIIKPHYSPSPWDTTLQPSWQTDSPIDPDTTYRSTLIQRDLPPHLSEQSITINPPGIQVAMWWKSLYLYFSSLFPYISVPVLMFSLSSCDLSLTLSLPLLQIVTMSLTSLLLCYHLSPFMMSTMRIGLASCHPFSALPYTAWPSVASVTKPSLSFLVESCSQDHCSLGFPNCASCVPLFMSITKQVICALYSTIALASLVITYGSPITIVFLSRHPLGQWHLP